jgi:hypothetical protein
VNHRFLRRIFLVVLVSLVFWTPSAPARLWPPCQVVSYTVPTVDSVSYSITDPVSGVSMAEIWTLTQGDAGQRFIESLRFDQGILTWIARYRSAGEAYFTYEVHFRIYDPGRGVWKAGSWGPFAGYNTSLENHVVKDGAVTWTVHRSLGGDPTAMLEHQVLYVTYDPQWGSWPLGQDLWQTPSTSQYRPQSFRVKNGIVAWAMKGAVAGEVHKNGFFVTIYDQESHLWNCSHINLPTNTLEIPDETAQVHLTFYFMDSLESRYYSYNSYTHQWVSYGYPAPQRRAFFVAQPDLGVVPLRVWFWDCSTSFPPLAAGDPANPYDWSWILAPLGLSSERSPTYLYTTPGLYTVTENVTQSPSLYSSTGQIDARPANPTGNISINSGAAYTASANVTLNLGYSSDATQMCFRESPGSIWWTPWEPVTPTKDWRLVTLFLIGETPDGPHSISVKFRDQYGIESPVSTASITLDVTPPAAVLTLNNGNAATDNPTVTVAWSASDAIGIAQMHYTSFDEGDSYYHWNLVDFSPPTLSYRPRPSTIKFSSKPGRKTVMVRFTDVAGNISHTQTSIQLKTASLPFLPLLLGD